MRRAWSTLVALVLRRFHAFRALEARADEQARRIVALERRLLELGVAPVYGTVCSPGSLASIELEVYHAIRFHLPLGCEALQLPTRWSDEFPPGVVAVQIIQGLRGKHGA